MMIAFISSFFALRRPSFGRYTSSVWRKSAKELQEPVPLTTRLLTPFISCTSRPGQSKRPFLRPEMPKSNEQTGAYSYNTQSEANRA